MGRYQRESRLGLAVVVGSDVEFLEHCLKSFGELGRDRHVFVAAHDWNGGDVDTTIAEEIARACGAVPIKVETRDEAAQRQAAIDYMAANGYRWVITADSDEIASAQLLNSLRAAAHDSMWEVVRCRMATYFLSPTLRVTPDERICPTIMVDCTKVEHAHIREYRARAGQKARVLVLEPDHGLLHHLSWVGSDKRLTSKIGTSSHRDEFVPDFWHRIMEAFKTDKTIRLLHPTDPHCYDHCERVPLAPELAGVPDLYPAPDDPPVPGNWPTLSVIIPLHGGEQEIRANLEGLGRIGVQPSPLEKGGKGTAKGAVAAGRANLGLVSEVIVVDDASPDCAAEVAASFPFVKLIRNEENVGFGESCNIGFAASTGRLVLFLNSDAVATRAALVRLVQTTLSSGSVGAAGPFTNESGYHQAILKGYSDIANLELYARDFASREVGDIQVPMLVGFALMMRRSVFKEVGGFDSQTFGKAMFEDNDIIYRLQRAGYKCLISARSYFHHEGSRTLRRMAVHPRVLLARNQKAYEDKWQAELASGFASHLPGQRAELIRFNPDREPAKVKRELDNLRRLADLSCCIIAKNEARVIGSCLDSIRPYVNEIILVDTGSSDATREIGRSKGAKVFDHPWEMSFSVARNHSLRHATGKRLIWIDADDTLAPESAEAILRACVHMPPNMAGIVPVRFVDEGPDAGTQVDHGKVLPNLPGLEFDGRIHEQIVPCLRRLGCEILRIPGAVVLHSGYDTSVEGQAAKRRRDRPLLWLDWTDTPGHPFKGFNLGMTQHFCNLHRAAIGWLKRSIAASGPFDSHMRKAYALMGASYSALGRVEKALDVYRQGLEAVGDDPELHFRIGIALSALGQLEAALAEYRMVSPDISGFFTSIDLGMLTLNG